MYGGHCIARVQSPGLWSLLAFLTGDGVQKKKIAVDETAATFLLRIYSESFPI